jgi:3',5'-cyclic AMP phosphodiesterase CpdA
MKKQTRRIFLGHSGAALAAPAFLFAVTGAGMAGARFAFISDMHYAHAGEFADGGTFWGLTEAGLVTLVDYLKTQNLDFVILGGDFCNTDAWFTDAAMIEDAHNAYDRVTTEFESLNIPIYYMLGNHEGFAARVDGVPDTNHEFYGNKLYRYHCGYGDEKATYYEFDHNGWKFICLDSGAMIGAIEPTQMSWLENVVQNTSPATPIALFCHGPLYPFFGDSPDSTRLVTNYEAVINVFKDHSLKMVYQGHLHKNEVREVTQLDSFGNEKKIQFILTGAAFMTVTIPGSVDGGFHILDTASSGKFTVSSAKSTTQPPVQILSQ